MDFRFEVRVATYRDQSGTGCAQEYPQSSFSGLDTCLLNRFRSLRRVFHLSLPRLLKSLAAYGLDFESIEIENECPVERLGVRRSLARQASVPGAAGNRFGVKSIDVRATIRLEANVHADSRRCGIIGVVRKYPEYGRFAGFCTVADRGWKFFAAPQANGCEHGIVKCRGSCDIGYWYRDVV